MVNVTLIDTKYLVSTLLEEEHKVGRPPVRSEDRYPRPEGVARRQGTEPVPLLARFQGFLLQTKKIKLNLTLLPIVSYFDKCKYVLMFKHLWRTSLLL